MVWRKMMNNTHRENGTMAGPLIFTVPAYGFVMALYLDSLGQSNRAVSAKTRRWLSDNSAEKCQRFAG
jgi:hypothetical protein